LSESQVRQLLRYTESKQVVFNFDADAAGVKATNRAIGEVADLAYRGGVQLRVLNIPEGKDADDFLKSASPEAYIALLDTAPLWIDWQIDRIVQERDITQADGYQQATQDFIKLLQRIENLSTRTYYINRCAEILAGGDARRVPTIAETLLTQVRRSRLPAQSDTRDPIPTPPAQLTGLDGDRALRLAAEEIILRLYLHCPELREPTIRAVQYLDQLRLDEQAEPTPAFSFAHHAHLWRSLLESIAGGHAANPLSWLQDRYADEPDTIAAIAHLLYLDEKTAQDIQRGEIALRSAIATIERTLRQTRYRLLLQRFEMIDLANHLDLARQYQQAIYAEKQRIDLLDRQRYTDVNDLVRVAFNPTLPTVM
ncbi:MAG: DNA primase, partial [Oscillatoriales cyanobacterium]